MFNPYANLPEGLKIFDSTSLAEAEGLAAGLTRQEVLDYFAVDESVLNSHPLDLDLFDKTYRRGRTIAKRVACDYLFVAMKGRNGAAAALAYLRQVGQEWPQAALDTSSSKQFSFKVVMDGDDD